jgi:GntR family transcriptional regulator, transcriptional repressor for pyruvate dehydrogenase complex
VLVDKIQFNPIKSKRAFEEVSNQLKQLIFEGVFKPGDRLPPEAELAQKFNVGRQSIREALRILELSGFIITQKGGGGGSIIKDTISSTISSLFLDAFYLEKISIEELTVARIDIEKVVLAHAINNADAGDIKSLHKNIAESHKKIQANNSCIDENIQFHNLMAKASKNHFFVIVVEALSSAMRHFMSQLGPNSQNPEDSEWYRESILKSKNTLSYHEDILAAIIGKYQQRAADLLEDHLKEVKGRLQVFVKQPETARPERY